MNHYKNGFALSNDDMIRATAEEIKVMHTKCMGPDDMISSLSGGNQQKAIFGKWLERSPNIFMMDDPTRGIDVGAKYEIYELIINMAKQGKQSLLYPLRCRKSLESQTGLVLCQMDILPELLILRKQIRKSY